MPTSTCPKCHAALRPDAVLCVSCGYNLSTGQQLKTRSVKQKSSKIRDDTLEEPIRRGGLFAGFPAITAAVFSLAVLLIGLGLFHSLLRWFVSGPGEARPDPESWAVVVGLIGICFLILVIPLCLISLVRAVRHLVGNWRREPGDRRAVAWSVLFLTASSALCYTILILPRQQKAAAENRKALWEAVSDGDPVKVQALLKAGVSVTNQDAQRGNLLHWGAIFGKGNRAVAEHLINAGVSPDLRDKHGRTPAYYAAEMGHAELAEYLLASSKEPEDLTMATLVTDARPLLNHVAAEGHLAVVRLLLARGAARAHLHLPDGQGRTPLHRAAKRKQVEMVDFLLANGADVQAVDAEGRTALHEGAEAGDLAVVRHLLAKGADKSAATKTGVRPLHLVKQSEELRGLLE